MENGNWEVKNNDTGVRVIRAKVGAKLDEWLRSADGSEERDLTVWEDMPQDPNTWSPFRVQVILTNFFTVLHLFRKNFIYQILLGFFFFV